jgi:hypothetical protein
MTLTSAVERGREGANRNHPRPANPDPPTTPLILWIRYQASRSLDHRIERGNIDARPRQLTEVLRHPLLRSNLRGLALPVVGLWSSISIWLCFPTNTNEACFAAVLLGWEVVLS